MKSLFALALALAAATASATGTHVPPPPAPTPSVSKSVSSSVSQQDQIQRQVQSQTQQSASTSGSTSDSTSYNGGNYAGDSNFYVLPAPITGGPLPAGMCQRSKYHHVSFVWSFVSVADGDSFTDLECLQVLLKIQELRAAVDARPQAPVYASTEPVRVIVEAPPAQSAPTCTPPSKPASAASSAVKHKAPRKCQ